MDTAKYKESIPKLTSDVQRLTNQAAKIDFAIPRPTNSDYGMEERYAKPVALKVILLILLLIALTVTGLTYWLLQS